MENHRLRQRHAMQCKGLAGDSEKNDGADIVKKLYWPRCDRALRSVVLGLWIRPWKGVYLSRIKKTAPETENKVIDRLWSDPHSEYYKWPVRTTEGNRSQARDPGSRVVGEICYMWLVGKSRFYSLYGSMV